MRTPLIIAVAATLVGCSREPPRQVMQSCAHERQFSCLKNRTAAHQRPMLASFWTNPPTETKLKTQRPQSYGASDRTAPLITKPKPNFVAAKTELSPTRILVLRPLSSTQQEPKSEVAFTGSSTIADPTVALAPNSSSRTIQEQVADAIAFAKKNEGDGPRTGRG